LILSTYIIKKRIYKRKKRSKKSEQTYKEIINILPEVYYNEPAITGSEKVARKEKSKREWPRERKGLKEWMGPKFGKNQTIPSQYRYCFRFMIYYTTR
jgi:hypothetical protein